jgi:hypothetical protein
VLNGGRVGGVASMAFWWGGSNPPREVPRVEVLATTTPARRRPVAAMSGRDRARCRGDLRFGLAFADMFASKLRLPGDVIPLVVDFWANVGMY